MQNPMIAVYGAAGHTGRFVTAELERRGVAVRRITRRAPEADPEGWATASCDDPDALDRALQGVDAVINCAGPFLDTAPAVIEAALRTGAHYLDVAAEQRSVRQSLATYADEARDRHLAVLPAMAFYGGLADLLATQLCDGNRRVDAIFIGVALDSWHPTSGTRRTGERNTARRVIVAGGRLAPVPAMGSRSRWEFPAPFGELPVVSAPLSEIVTLSKHIEAQRIESFMNEAPLRDLGSADTPPPKATDASGRSGQQFVMDVEVVVHGSTRRIAAFGRDIYAVTAPLVVEACLRLLSLEHCGGGTYAPAEILEPPQFLTALSSSIRLELGPTAPLGLPRPG